MFDLKTIFLGFGVIAIIGGFLEWYEPYVRWQVKQTNAARGLKNTITKETFVAHRRNSLMIFLVAGVAIYVALTLF